MSNILFNLTPKWELSRNLKNSFSGQNLKRVDISKYNINTKPPRLSVCMIVKNEEQNIKRCLESVKDIAYQIIVVDTGSTDKTKELAKSYNVELYEYKWDNNFSNARNESLKYATGDWVLFLDADEELRKDASLTLKKDMEMHNIIGLRLPLENVGSPLNGSNFVPRHFIVSKYLPQRSLLRYVEYAAIYR